MTKTTHFLHLEALRVPESFLVGRAREINSTFLTLWRKENANGKDCALCKYQACNLIMRQGGSPGNLSHFRTKLETNCNSFHFTTMHFYEVPEMTY